MHVCHQVAYISAGSCSFLLRILTHTSMMRPPIYGASVVVLVNLSSFGKARLVVDQHVLKTLSTTQSTSSVQGTICYSSYAFGINDT